jgi:hypothetical protein
MRGSSRLISCLIFAVVISATPSAAEGQGRGNSRAESPIDLAVADVRFSVEVQDQIRLFYHAHPTAGAQALPPGIRRNLARGKGLPPGIAKKVAPPELVTLIHLPAGYEVVEVGLDVLLVEIATNIVHDVLMDVIR